ncbi:6-phosphofructokinase [Pasteurellaceae bacterium LIM206]|nr:6-phosphofructokinase [Pasteurellaceae bacterium LIM206]
MKKIVLIAAVSLLAGCSIINSTKKPAPTVTPVDVPKTFKHDGKTYTLKMHKDLGSVARYIYFPKKETSQNWKSQIEVFVDRQEPAQTLAERIALRNKVYKNLGVEHFNLTEKDNALYSFVIYAPNAQYNDWQVNVAKGENVAGCGFAQYQYVMKVPKTKKLMNMGKVKLVGYLKKYVVDKEMAKLAVLNWQWSCKKAEL